MKSITKRLITTLALCGALVLEAGATAIGSLGKALNNIAKVDAATPVTVTYAQTSTTAASVSSGTAPTGSSVDFNNTYNTKEQLTKNNSMTFTLKGYAGHKITALSMSMHSNKSAGTGKFSLVAGSTTLAEIASNTGFNQSAWYGSWTQDYVTVTPTMSNSSYEIKNGEDVVLTISASANSLFCQSITLTYEKVGDTPTTGYSVTYDGNGNTGGSVPTDSTSYSSGASVTVKDNTGSLVKTGFTFDGWNTQADGKGTSYSAGSTFNIAANTTLYANWKSSGGGTEEQIIIDASTLNLNSDGVTSETSYGGYTFAPGGSSNKVKSYGGDNRKNNFSDNGAILIGKKGAYLYNTVGFAQKAVKFEMYWNIGGSTAGTLSLGIQFSDSPLTSYSTGTNTYTNSGALTQDAVYDLSSYLTSNCKYFYLKVNSDHNAQVQFRVTLEKAETKTVTSIAVKQAPSKTTYYEGETFNPAGLIITATYDDESTADIAYADHTSDFSFSPSGSLATTDNKVTITYKEKTVDQAITVNSDTLNSITLGGSVTGTVSGGWDLSGVTVTGNYVSGSRLITNATPTTSTPAPTEFKEYTVSVSVTYKGVSDNKDYTVDVKRTGKSADDPLLASDAMKLSSGEYFVEGVVAKVSGTYSSDYGNKNVFITDDGSYSSDKECFEFYRLKWINGEKMTQEQFDSIVVGSKIVAKGTITTYSGQKEFAEGCQLVSLINKEVSSIAVTTNPTNSQYSGKAFDKTGMVVTATYNDGSKADVTSSVVIEPATLASNTTSVTIKYTEDENTVQTTLGVDVLALNRITVENQTTEFRAGDTFSFDGDVYPWFTHSNGNPESKGSALASTEYTVSKSGSLSRGNDQEVVITHTASSKTCSYTIDVDYAYVTGISMDNAIELGLGGEATFSASVSPELADQSVTYSIDTDSTTLLNGEYTLTDNKLEIAADIVASGDVYVIATTVGKDAEGQSKTTSCKVTVKKAIVAQITAVTVSGAVTATEQYVGKDFDYTGLTFTPVWSEGEHETVTITGADIDWPALTNGMTSIKGQYDTGSSKLDVDVSGFTVVEDYLKSITIAGDMTNKTYYSNADEWNFAGLLVTGKNASGDDATIVQANVEYTANLTPAEYLSTSAEKLVVTATYGGKTDTIDIAGIVVNEYKLNKIEVTTNPSKVEYIIGETFSEAGLVVKATYSDGTTDTDFKGYTLDRSAIDMYKAGTYSVKVQASGVTDAAFNVKYGVITPQEGSSVFTKVTSNLSDFTGTYLILTTGQDSKSNNFYYAFNGSITTPKDAQTHFDMSEYWTNDKTSFDANDDLKAVAVSIKKVTDSSGTILGYTIQGVCEGAPYIGKTANSNGMDYFTTEKDANAKYNQINIDTDGNAIINGYGSTTGGLSALKYNKNLGTSGEMFRFYKDGGSAQTNIMLFKLEETEPIVAELIKLNVSCSKTFKEGETLNISDLTVNGLYNDGNTKAITTGVTFSDGSSSKVLAPGDNNLTVKCGGITENITITATPLVKYDLSVTINDDQAEYTISPALTDGKLIGGEDYTIEVSAKAGYVIESVTATGTGSTVSGNVVTITNASSDVSITVTSRALETFGITYDGTNADYATISPKPSTIVEGNDLDLTVTANENKKIDAVVVTMDGVEQTGAYSAGKIHLDDVSGDIKITVDCSYISYEVDFSGSDEEITFNPATTEYNQGAEFNVTAEFSEFLYEIDLDNSSYSMEGGGTLSLVGNVLHADAVTGKITISLVLKEIPHEVEIDDNVEGYTISDISEDATGLTVTLALEEHYSALPSSIECSIEGTAGTKSYTVSDNKIVIPAEDVTGKVTLLTSATHADCSFVAGDIVGVEGSIISSPKDYKENIDYTFTLKEGFDPETLTVTMTSYGSEFTDFELTKLGDTYHVKFVIVGDTVINIAAEAKITNDLTNTLVTTSNTDETIEVGANYTATLSFADGCDPDKTTVKVEMRDSLGELQDITASAYNSTTHEISISGVTGEIIVTAHTELKQFNVTLSGDNLLDSEYATVVVCVDGKPVTLVGGSVKVTYGEFVQISIELKDGKKYADGYPVYLMDGSTEGLDWDDDGILTVDSLTGDLSFEANIEKIGVSASMQYDVTIIENTTSPEAIYEGEEVVYEFVIINPNAYEFDQETSKIETYVGGVLTDITTESGVWYYDDDSGILRITISNPNTHVGIKIGHKDIEYTVTSPEDAKFYSLNVPETIHYGDENVAIEVVADAHCHVDGVRVFLGEEELTVNVEYEYSAGVVTIKEIKGNYVIEATAAHDNVTITLDSSSENITFNLDNPQASYAYETTITGYFSVVAPYKLPGSIKVFEYGVEIGNDKYTYSPTTGVFSIKAEGDITIIAKGSLGTVTVGLSDESSANASLSPTPEAEYDEGASFEATVIVDSGYQIVSVVVKMGGSSIKAFNPYDNSIFILNLTGDVEITVVTEKIYCEVNIISYNGYSDGDAIISIEYGSPLEVTFTPDNGYHLDDYDTFYGTMGGEDISAYYSNGVLSIPEVTGTIDVSFQGWPDTYTVTTDLGESTLDTDVYVLEHGDEFFGQVTPNEGYKITSMVVTMGGNPVTVTDYGFDILSVTGDVVITVVTEKITHTITNTLTHATNNNTTSPVEYGSQYIANISAAEGYENLTVTVKMGGVDVTSACYSNGVIIISKVTGDIEITASAVASKVNVSVDVTNVTCSIESQQVDYNSALEFTLTQDDNTFDYVYSVTMGGEPVDGLNGVYTIEHVTGDIAIKASATEIVPVGISATLDDGFKVVDYDSEFPIARVTVVIINNDGSTTPYDGEITFSGYNKAQYGTQDVVISAAGFTTSVEIEVLKSTVVQEVTGISTYEVSYDFGYDLTIEDIIVFYDTTDGLSHADAPDEIVEGSYDITTSGNQNVQVRFDGQVYDVLVHINASTEIESISAVVVSGKEELEYGAPFTAEDVIVTAKYTDKLTDTIDAEYVEFDGVPGKNVVIVHAAGKICTVEVTVKASEVIDHIEASSNDESYAYGYELQPSDFTVTAFYTDGDQRTIDATAVSPTSLTSGLNVVTVTAGGKTCQVVVKVDDSTEVASINAVIKDGKDTVAYEGAFTADDVTVYATYTDGKTKVVTGFTMSGFDNKHIGVNTVTIILDGKTCTVKVTVLASTVVDHIEAVATKDNLTYGDTFTKDDVKVTEVYTDGHKVENLAADSISGFEGKVGVNNVTVVYDGKEAVIQVTVKASEVIDSIEAVVNEGKSELEYGAPFTKDDVTVTATYTDGHTAVVAAESVDFAGTVGENIVTVHVGEKTCEVTVTVKASEVIDHIEVSTDKTTVKYGESFTKEDVKVTYVYTDGHKVENQVAESISGFDSLTIGEQNVTVTAVGKEATLKVTVDGHVVTSITVTGYDEYVDQGKEYVFNGIVTANYADGQKEVISEGYAVSKLDTSKHGPQTAKVTYEGHSAEITVNVIQTQTEVEPYQTVAIIGGSVIGVAVLAVGVFLFLKMFKL